MKIDIKKSTKTVNYNKAIQFLEKKVNKVIDKKSNELIWILEHPYTFTGGKTYNKSEIIDKKINIIDSARGGKITWHGPGQLICYFVIDLNKRKKDIRKFLSVIENTIIETLKKYNINSFSDRKNVGIWVKKNNKTKKVAAIGIRVKKWVAYHGFSINVSNDLKKYNNIIPCGIKNKGIINLKEIGKSNFNNIEKYQVYNVVDRIYLVGPQSRRSQTRRLNGNFPCFLQTPQLLTHPLEGNHGTHLSTKPRLDLLGEIFQKFRKKISKIFLTKRSELMFADPYRT